MIKKQDSLFWDVVISLIHSHDVNHLFFFVVEIKLMQKFKRRK